MQTAMQELIEYLNSVEEDFKQKNWIELASVASMAIDKARKYLEKEKEQLQKAFSDGQEIPINHPTIPHYSRDEYYNDNYNN